MAYQEKETPEEKESALGLRNRSGIQVETLVTE